MESICIDLLFCFDPYNAISMYYFFIVPFVKMFRFIVLFLTHYNANSCTFFLSL